MLQKQKLPPLGLGQHQLIPVVAAAATSPAPAFAKTIEGQAVLAVGVSGEYSMAA